MNSAIYLVIIYFSKLYKLILYTIKPKTPHPSPVDITQKTPSQLHHKPVTALQGGIAVVSIKGAMNIYFKHHQYLRQAMRRIDNYDHEKAALEELERAMNNNSEPTAQ